ncbi:MAG: hypothetical protein NTY19_28095 [Planctomycetota bacterium]|nr:hypothetical protein [Planctomycetota bacterium]
MSRVEKVFAIVYFACLLAGPFLPMPAAFWALFQLLWMASTIPFLVILFRDLRKRPFPDPDSRLIWTFLIILLPPLIAAVYLGKHGFRPRPESKPRFHEIANAKGPRLGHVIVVCTIVFAKLSLAAPCFLWGFMMAFMGLRLQGFSPLECRAIGLCASLGGIGIGYPFFLIPVSGITKYIVAASSALPFCLLMAGLSDTEASMDPAYRIVGGIMLLGVALTAADIHLSKAPSYIHVEGDA